MPDEPAIRGENFQCWTIELPGDRAVDVFIRNLPDDERMLAEVVREGGDSASVSYTDEVRA
jgi:hypothetical protein